MNQNSQWISIMFSSWEMCLVHRWPLSTICGLFLSVWLSATVHQAFSRQYAFCLWWAICDLNSVSFSIEIVSVWREILRVTVRPSMLRLLVSSCVLAVCLSVCLQWTWIVAKRFEMHLELQLNSSRTPTFKNRHNVWALKSYLFTITTNRL